MCLKSNQLQFSAKYHPLKYFMIPSLRHSFLAFLISQEEGGLLYMNFLIRVKTQLSNKHLIMYHPIKFDMAIRKKWTEGVIVPLQRFSILDHHKTKPTPFHYRTSQFPKVSERTRQRKRAP